MVSGTETIGAIAEGLGQGRLQVINFLGQYHNAGAVIFSSTARLDVHPAVSFLVLLGWTALAVWVLRRRIRPVEVVS